MPERWGFGGKAAGTIKKILAGNSGISVIDPTGPTVTLSARGINTSVVTASATGGHANVTAAGQLLVGTAAGLATWKTVALSGDVTGALTANVVAKVPDTALVAGTRITLATTAGKAKISSSGTGIITAETSATGVALINGTQTILTATVPNDGKVHLLVGASVVKDVTTALTGGKITIKWTTGAGDTRAVSTGLTTVTAHSISVVYTTASLTLKAGTLVTLEQTTAMTAGAAKVYAKIVVI